MSIVQSNGALVEAQTVLVATLGVAFGLGMALRALRRTRPGLSVAAPLAVAVGLRLAAIAALGSSALSSTLRGGDETTFLTYATFLADSPIGQGFLPHGPYQLHTVLFALELKYGEFNPTAMRVVQVGVAMLGVLLIIAAIYDLAGPHAARIGAWVLAFEPGSIFFNSALHKEPLMLLASGLVVFGGTKLWRQLDLSGIAIAGLGGLIAVQTRPYAGWFLISGAVFLLLHASLRRLDRPLRAMPLIYAVVIVAFIAAPVLIQASSKESLKALQISQDANTDPGATTGQEGSNNLALERVDYSERGAVLTNLPQRMLDVLTRPYPWQLANTSQQLGAAGSVFALAALAMLIGAVWRRRGQVLALTAPLLYPTFFLLMAYSLSAGNAGTGFRYRTHIVTLGIAMLLVLREHLPAHASARNATLARVEPTGQAADLPMTPQGRTA